MKKLTSTLLLCLILASIPFIVSAEYDISPQVRSQMDEIEAVIKEVRGLDRQSDVVTSFISPSEFELYRGEPDSTYFHETTQFYRSFDLVEASTDLWEWSQSINGQSEVNGVYLPMLNEITIVLISESSLGDNLPLRERTVYAHEFTHALQHQNFDLSNLLIEYSENADAMRAFRAMVEGDAMVTEQEYIYAVNDPDMLALDILGFGEYDASTPSILIQEAYLPYLYGQNFVKALQRKGGWDAVNYAYENPPLSTEHILHPEAYFAEDNPLPVSLSTMRNVVDDTWSLLREDTLGEFYLREYLSTQLDMDMVDSASTGWGGDRFAMYYNRRNDDRAWVFRLAWDTALDQTEFADSYRQFANLRMNAESQMIDDVECWESVTTGEALCVLATATDVQFAHAFNTLIGYGPSLDIAFDMLDSQRGWR